MIKFRSPIIVERKEKTEKEKKPGSVKDKLKKVGMVLGTGLIVTGAALTGKEIASKEVSTSDPENETEEITVATDE